MNELSEIEINTLLGDAIVDRIEAMECELLEHDQVLIIPKNNHINGMYTREILIPKGTLLTGRVHLFDYVDIMLSGDITVATEAGPVRYVGANVFDGKAGRKRAGYAHEDTRWISVHATDLGGDEFYNICTVQTMREYQQIDAPLAAALTIPVAIVTLTPAEIELIVDQCLVPAISSTPTKSPTVIPVVVEHGMTVASAAIALEAVA